MFLLNKIVEIFVAIILGRSGSELFTGAACTRQSFTRSCDREDQPLDPSYQIDKSSHAIISREENRSDDLLFSLKQSLNYWTCRVNISRHMMRSEAQRICCPHGTSTDLPWLHCWFQLVSTETDFDCSPSDNTKRYFLTRCM